MRKIQYIFTAIIAALCSAACSDDEDIIITNSSEFVYSFSLNEDILSVDDFPVNLYYQ